VAKSLHEQILKVTGTANEEVLDRAIRHAVYLQRYKTGEVNKIVGFLNDDVLPDALARLTTRLERIASRGIDSGAWTTQRFKDVLAGLDKTLGAGLREAGAQVRKDLGDFAVSEAEYQARVLAGAIPAGTGIDFSLPGAGQLRSIVTSKPFQGDVLGKHWSKIGASAKADIARQLRIGLAEGETTAQIVRRVSGTKAGGYMDGVFGKLRRNVESTVRTAANHVSTHAREDTYKENDDVVKGVEIVATLDGRTTEICMSEDGKVYDVGEGPRPPFHYNCRTTTVPVLKSWKELGIDLKEAPEGTRASLNGQVPAKQTYGAWLKRQPRAVQDEALGPARARLFRSGKVKVDRFVDDRRRKLTLKELRAREGLEEV
jgi:SPP1 gp7 family putative phage head morphogenesis protein